MTKADLMFLLLSLSWTGAIYYVIWKLIQVLLKGFKKPDYFYWIDRVLLFTFLIPYVFVFEHWRSAYLVSDNAFIFPIGKPISYMFDFLLTLYIYGLVVVICYFCFMRFRFWQVRRQCETAPDSYYRLCYEIQKDMGIKTKPQIKWGYGIGAPFVFGFFSPCIYLPIRDYTDEELIVILRHELQHYKNGDLLWQGFAELVCLLHYFNPFVWLLKKDMDRWGESYCDARCSGYVAIKRYFGIILNLSEELTGYYAPVAAMWNEHKNELKWRVRIMKKERTKRNHWVFYSVLTVIGFLASGITTNAATRQVGQVYSMYYFDHVENEIDQEQDHDDYEEVEGNISDWEGLTVVEAEANGGFTTASNSFSYNWYVTTNMVKQSTGFYVSNGGTIYVAGFMTPSNKQLTVGIVRPDGSTASISAMGDFSHTFTANQSGTYKLYFKNTNLVPVTVQGFCRY